MEDLDNEKKNKTVGLINNLLNMINLQIDNYEKLEDVFYDLGFLLTHTKFSDDVQVDNNCKKTSGEFFELVENYKKTLKLRPQKPYLCTPTLKSGFSLSAHSFLKSVVHSR